MSNAECPECGAEIEIEHEDGPGDNFEYECPKCLKSFSYSVELIEEISCAKAPCLNGAEHNWRKIEMLKEYPDWKECRWCGREERGKRVESSQ